MELWYALTLLGSSYFWMGISGGLFLVFIIARAGGFGKGDGIKRLLFILIPALVITFLLVVSMKAVFGVERVCVPCPGEGCNPYCPEDASFPSGHAASAFAGFTSIFLFLGRKKFLVLYAIPILVAASRFALGVHSWVDILAGALVGIVIPLLVLRADRRFFGQK